MDEQLIPSIPTQSDDEMEFQLVSRNKRRRTGPASPEPAQKEPEHHCKHPVILTGLPTDFRNPIAIRRYIEDSHPTAQVIGIRTSRGGLTIIAAQNATSQKELLGNWKPIRGRTPTARLPKEKKEERPGPIEGVIVGLHPEITAEEVVEELQGNANRLDPCSFRWFYRKGTKTPTWKGAVTFKTQEDLDRAVTRGVTIGFQHHRRFGHFAANCNHRKTCLRCAGHHALADCPTPRDSPKCANCRRSHIASYRGCSKFVRATEEATAKKAPPPPKTPGPPRPSPPVTNSNSVSSYLPQITETLEKNQQVTLTKMEERHQLQLEALRLQHQATIERIEEANGQLFHQLREDTEAQLNELKGKITHFLGDVLTTLIPQKGDTAPSDLRKATVIKEKAWLHLGLAIDISRIREELLKKSPTGKKTSSQ
ncbi:hypothetical protein HOLleu_35769 [Holothuria leucospilota]|uniref:Uncharacterized protein n=1 Tax=Holothuria leucospilota TaxID=206669 RepID=A0A9Q0YL86_HOLLE|nr:hypothetical protein HOLleu_35769 [Holothuria leucospilota]